MAMLFLNVAPKKTTARKAKPKPKTMGRPKIAAEDRRTRLIRVLTNEDEHAELQSAADTAGIPLSTWLRAVGLAEARKT